MKDCWWFFLPTLANNSYSIVEFSALLFFLLFVSFKVSNSGIGTRNNIGRGVAISGVSYDIAGISNSGCESSKKILIILLRCLNRQ